MMISLKEEIKRKSVHLSSLWMPAAYVFLEEYTMLWLIGVLLAGMAAIDVLRRRVDWIKSIFTTYCGGIVRSHEGKELLGATYVLLGAWLTIFLFPKIVAIMALLVLVIADTAAALIGKRYGRHALFDKSWEGSIAFFVSAIVCVMATYIMLGEPGATPWLFTIFPGTVASAAATWVELHARRWRIDDNILIPLTFGAVWTGTFMILTQLIFSGSLP